MSYQGLAMPSGMNTPYIEGFPDPFKDVASLNMPTGLRTALRLCETIFMTNGTYRMAMHRILSYFLTEIEVETDSDDDRKDNKEFLENTLGLINSLQQMYIDRMCYGNAFATVLVPFKRFLKCPRCHTQAPLGVIYDAPKFRFRWYNMEFHANCVNCSYAGKWDVVDMPEDLEKRLKIKIWNPHELEILHDPYTNECAYLWRIPEDYKAQIRQGRKFHLERVAKPVLEAIKKNVMFRFHPEQIFHMREPVPCGIRSRGWGIPRILHNFRQIYYVQVLRRYNEALALDYVIPFRLITPVARTGASGGQMAANLDPLLSVNMGDFRSQVMSMIRRRRRDPAGWNVLPFPVQYQSMGGDASQLAPRDLMDQGLQQLLNDAGTPLEMFNGTLSLQTAPVALRLFESTNYPLVRDGNEFIEWVVKQVTQILQWTEFKASLRKVTYVDDVMRQTLLLQLMTGQQISKMTGLGALGLNSLDETRRMAEESRNDAEIQAKLQETMEESGMAQQMAMGPGAAQPAPAGPGQSAPAGAQGGSQGAPMGMDPTMAPVTAFLQSQGPNPSMDIQTMQESAQQLAGQLVVIPHAQRVSQLRELKNANESLHALVKSNMEKLRGNAKNQGQQLVLGG